MSKGNRVKLEHKVEELEKRIEKLESESEKRRQVEKSLQNTTQHSRHRQNSKVHNRLTGMVHIRAMGRKPHPFIKYSTVL